MPDPTGPDHSGGDLSRPDLSGRGVLYPARLPAFTRVPAPEEVADRVRWFWIPEWDLAPGRVSRQHLIAFPACNLVVEGVLVGLSGPATRASYRDLEGRGWAVGALLRPAAVPTLVDDPAAIRDTFEPRDLPELAEAVGAAMDRPEPDRHAAVRAFADWVGAHVPSADEEGRLANTMADLLDADGSVRTLADAAGRLHVSARTLQRLAARYVGLPPAAMIRRRRLQEAAERIRQHPGTDLAAVATELGYADQAHLTHDFRTVLGFTPSSYRRPDRP